ncbi:MAG TPA: DUF222 domain-containing protein [Amnibacterium sp.]|jgi:hypothetical protein|uniref:HNH endonuclease signature motif containing protein n=1 Tax=Amnibacterium sp. TaxID=1872496 RepID=UPI002F945E1A
MEMADRLVAEATALGAVPCRPVALDDSRLLDEIEAWERIGRLADARRTALAGEIAWRSREQIGEASLAKREGQRDAVDLLAQELRISTREAKRRTALGLRLRSRLSLLGEELPGRWAHVAAALEAGAIGVDAARVIVDALGAVARRADAEDLQVAEAALVESARSMSADLLRVQAEVWQAALDPDGAKPAEDAAHVNRSAKMGRESADGITVTILKTETEVTALLRAALNSGRRGVQWVRQPADDCEDDSEWHEAADDQRSRAQFDHDTLIDIIRAGLRASDDEAASPASSPAEVIVVVKADDLEAGRGCGWADGIAGRIAIPTVRRLQCSGSTRLAVTGGEGEVLHLSHAKRLFTRAQRRALAVRDGGCAWPGCSAPVAWTEAHHIAWVARDDGTTDVENGVLLCSFHHHRIHSSDEWEIRVHGGAPYLVPRRWRGAPSPRHRMQRHRLHQAGDPPGQVA